MLVNLRNERYLHVNASPVHKLRTLNQKGRLQRAIARTPLRDRYMNWAGLETRPTFLYLVSVGDWLTGSSRELNDARGDVSACDCYGYIYGHCRSLVGGRYYRFL